MLAIAALLFEWCGPLIVDDVDAFGLNLPIGRYIHIHITPTVDLDDSCNFFMYIQTVFIDLQKGLDCQTMPK